MVRAIMTPRPPEMLCNPKNTYDQLAFNASWMAKSMRATARKDKGGDSHNRQAAIAMRKYRIGQTIGNAMRGGVHDGFTKDAYQVGIWGDVTLAPNAATLKQTPSITASGSKDFKVKPNIGSARPRCTILRASYHKL